MSPNNVKTNILLTGATGYIGGEVLSQLLEHPKFSSFNITALVRSPEKAEKIRALGVLAVIGSHSDETLVEKLASDADVVIATADANNLVASRATLSGLKKRYEATKVQPALIHTSGTGVLCDTAFGKYATDDIYDDLNPDQIETLAPTQPHRNVDLEIVAADKEGYVKTYIVLPSTIYGISTSKLVELGIQNPYSIQIPALIKNSIARGQGGVVGEGKNIWPHVEISEVAEIYVKLLDAVVAKSNPGHGREGFYFAENGEYTFSVLGKRISEVLVELGKGTNRDVTTVSDEDAKVLANYGLASNSRCRANRARSTLGWNPKKTTDDFYGSIKAEVEAVLKRI
ncbi:hypothetical protein DFP72DRAFT_971947 [Ephemerocybe angulata]|uniref:NAD(P)-binding domain-containing protein n=1 Tax=Ephemerocybe angulata TaxID=980116 RepID=A0A8H6HLM7_9AGAR|nr:hypothetical protein DFP72DRAFT_971947 [Tulosesus angulatus]